MQIKPSQTQLLALCLVPVCVSIQQPLRGTDDHMYVRAIRVVIQCHVCWWLHGRHLCPWHFMARPQPYAHTLPACLPLVLIALRRLHTHHMHAHTPHGY